VGIYAPDGDLVGMARAVTDRATFAWVSDVFVLEPHRGRGLGRWVVSALLGHPDVAGLRWTMLATADAHGLYRSFGFAELDTPERFMGRAQRGESRPE
jgi:GNAT superfamily N-acetyltransferase